MKEDLLRELKTSTVEGVFNNGHKNVGPQLNGVLKDLLSNWERNNLDNSTLDKHYLNSANSVFGNDFSKTVIKKKIDSEFRFFEKDYWTDRFTGFLKIYFSGHGEIGHIPCDA